MRIPSIVHNPVARQLNLRSNAAHTVKMLPTHALEERGINVIGILYTVESQYSGTEVNK